MPLRSTATLFLVHPEVLVALYENATLFEFRCIGPDTPQHAEVAAALAAAQVPLLLNGERQVVERSVVIEYLCLAHPGPVLRAAWRTRAAAAGL